MATLTGSPEEPTSNLTVPTVGSDADAWGGILNDTSLQALLNYVLWLKARVPATDPSGQVDGKALVVQSGVIAYGEAGAGGGAADGVTYDNTTSGLDAEDVQAAIDEIVGGLGSAAAEDASAFATAAQGAKADAALPKSAVVNSYAGNRALDASDSGAYVRITAAGTVTLPDGLSTGFQCVIVNGTDSDAVALSAATTLSIPSGFDAAVENRRAVTVIHVGSNAWEAHGALEESA